MSTRQNLNSSWLFFAVTLMAFNCDNKTIVSHPGTASICGGFQAFSKQKASTPSFSIDSASYCEAERLWWQYDSTRNYLNFLHARVVLNCAAKLSITAQIDGDTIILNETDTRSAGVQAGCACSFDTYLEVPNVKPGAVFVNISSKTFSIDTKAGKGVFVLDSVPDSVCIQN
jgi:hypothetical protein